MVELFLKKQGNDKLWIMVTSGVQEENTDSMIDLLEDAGGMGYHGGSAGLGSGEQTHQSAESYQPAISSRAWTVFHPTYISGAQC